VLKESSSDGPATSLSVSAASIGRKLVGRWVYPLTGIETIPASTWTVTYRAKTSGSASSVVAHGDVDVLIRKSDNTLRMTIATDVANSPSLTLVNTWQTLTGTYDWAAYAVVDQTDYLEVAYYIEVTTAQNSKSVYLRIDDNSLALADQTKIENVMFTYPNQAPVASFTFSPTDPVIYEVVTFNASASYDPDGSIVSYRWDFGDGNITTVTNPIITHVYTTAASTVNYTVTLTVTDNEGSTGFTTQIVPVTNPSILHVSLPAGSYEGVDPDPWLNEGWLLNINSGSGTFTLRINDTSGSITSYDTHLIIAINNASYNNLVSLSVNGTPIPQSAFQYGTPNPYSVKNWPSGDVYPTWFADTYIIGTIDPKAYKDLTVSVTFSNATGARMHFDSYGSKETVPPPPDSTGKVTHNPLSEDSTVSFFPPPVEQYYLTVTSTYGTIGGQGWYVSGSTAYATLNTGTVDHGNGTRRLFLYWSGDASGTNYAQSNPIIMNSNKTAIAVWQTQYYLTVTSPYGVTSGSGWYNASSTAYADLNTGTVDHGNGTRRVFTNWSGDASGTNYAQSNPITMNGPKTAIANWKTQYLVTFDQTGLSSDAIGTVVTVDSVSKAFGDLPFSKWLDNGNTVAYSYENYVSSSIIGKRYRLASVTGPSSPFAVLAPTTVIGNYVAQYQVAFDQTGVGTDFNGTIVTMDAVGYNRTQLPASFWWDENSIHNFSFGSPLVVNASKQYTWVSTSGLSTLQSGTLTVTTSGNVIGNYTSQLQYLITFDQTGVEADFPGTVVIIDGTNYSAGALPVSFWWDADSVHNFSYQSPLAVTPNAKRYVWNSTSGLSTVQSGSLTVTMSGSMIGHYKTQYYLTVVSPYGTTSGEGWYYSGSTAYANLNTGIVDHGNGTHRVFTNWSGDASGTNYVQSNPISMDAAKTAIAVWKTQYRLIMATNYGTTNPSVGEHWYDAGSVVPISATAPLVIDGERYVWLGWTGTGTISYTGMDNPASVTMNSPINETAAWRHEYQLTMATNYGTTTPAVGQQWYPAGQQVSIQAFAPSLVYPGQEQFVWNGWVGTGNGSYTGISNPASITMNGPITETATWLRQFLLTIKTSGLPSTYPTKVYLGGSQVGTASDSSPYTKWINAGASTGIIGIDSTVSGATGTRYVFKRWVEDSSTSNPRASETMNSPKTYTAEYKTQYLLTVRTDPPGLTPQPTRNPMGEAGPSGSWWYDSSTNVTLTAQTVAGYTFTEWDVDGSYKGSGVNPITVHMNAPHTTTAHYKPPPQAPVGGRTVALTQQASAIPTYLAAYIALIALFGAALSLAKRKRK